MSSLMQFSGDVSAQGVGLQFVLVAPVTNHLSDTSTYPSTVPVDVFTCPTCKRSHSLIYVAYRKPVDMLGCWVRFRFNGELHAPDLSLPIEVDRLPRDAKALTIKETADIWHS